VFLEIFFPLHHQLTLFLLVGGVEFLLVHEELTHTNGDAAANRYFYKAEQIAFSQCSVPFVQYSGVGGIAFLGGIKDEEIASIAICYFDCSTPHTQHVVFLDNYSHLSKGNDEADVLASSGLEADKVFGEEHLACLEALSFPCAAGII